MIFKLKYRIDPIGLIRQVHVQMFVGKNLDALQLSGSLVFREEEWAIFFDVITAATREQILDPTFVQVLVEEVGDSY